MNINRSQLLIVLRKR